TEGNYRERRPEVRPTKYNCFRLSRPRLRHLQTGNRYRTRFVTQAPTASVTVAVPGWPILPCRNRTVSRGEAGSLPLEASRALPRSLDYQGSAALWTRGCPRHGKDELDVWTARGGVADDQVYDDAGRIGGIFQRLSAHACQRIAAAGGFQRVSID